MRIRVRDVRVIFAPRGITALDGVSIEVTAGEQVALLGASGAGKTTLLRCLLGAVTPTSGSIEVGGRDPGGSEADRRWVRRHSAVIRQSGDLVPSLRARTNVLLGTGSEWGPRDWGAAALGRRSRWDPAIEALAARHGIIEVLDARVGELSGGQRQRVALLRALIGEPRLLLADEPTAGLDPPTAAAAVGALRAVDGVTLLVSTHDLEVAREFPRVVAMRAGAVVHDGPGFSADDAARVYGADR